MYFDGVDGDEDDDDTRHLDCGRVKPDVFLAGVTVSRFDYIFKSVYLNPLAWDDSSWPLFFSLTV